MASEKPPDPSEVSPDTLRPEPDAVRRQMDQILKSPGFRATTAQRTFLQFVVEKVLAGEADEIKGYFDAEGLISFQEGIANTVAGKITCEAGIISRTLTLESKQKPPNELKTYEAILRYYEFNVRFTAGTFFSAFDALTFASEKEPECGRLRLDRKAGRRRPGGRRPARPQAGFSATGPKTHPLLHQIRRHR